MFVQAHTQTTLVRVDTDCGVSGIGEAYWGYGVENVIKGYLRDIVMGQDPLDIEPLFTKMLRRTGGAGSQAGVTVTAASGVEIALWDLAGKLLGCPCANCWAASIGTGCEPTGLPTPKTGSIRLPAASLRPCSRATPLASRRSRWMRMTIPKGLTPRRASPDTTLSPAI